MSYGGAQSFYQKMLAAQQAKAAEAAGGASGASTASAAAQPPKSELQLEAPKVNAPDAPVVLTFGSTNYSQMGKKVGEATERAPNLLGPHRLLAGFGDVRITYLATGCTSAHIIALGSGGEVFAWGRNDAGQLGLGDTVLRAGPTRVASGLSNKTVISAATGKAHSVFVTAAGELIACGACKMGAVGNGVNKKTESQPKPTPLSVGASFTAVAAGSNFNLAIDSTGDVWAWGWSQYGVLGTGTDGEFNMLDGGVKLSYRAEYTPRRVPTLIGQKCIDVACGQYHCAAISGEGIVHTWGNGGYGRLGHKDQNDVWTPKPHVQGLRARKVTCGQVCTAALGWPVLANGTVCTGAPSLFMWGRVRSATQNSWMYPQVEEDLRGWQIHAMCCGASHNVAHADSSVISWGSGCLSGELGFGENGKKSSARPAKVDSLEGVSIAQITCGLANSFLLAEKSAKTDALPEWTPVQPPEGSAEAAAEEKPAGKGKRPAAGAGGAPSKKGKK